MTTEPIPPKRFPDRVAIDAVREECEPLEAGRVRSDDAADRRTRDGPA